jgi:hypothetical protein
LLLLLMVVVVVVVVLLVLVLCCGYPSAGTDIVRIGIAVVPAPRKCAQPVAHLELCPPRQELLDCSPAVTESLVCFHDHRIFVLCPLRPLPPWIQHIAPAIAALLARSPRQPMRNLEPVSCGMRTADHGDKHTIFIFCEVALDGTELQTMPAVMTCDVMIQA